MSITRTARVQCPCGAEVEVLVADSLNAGRHPHLRQAVLERRLHHFVCTYCGRDFLVEQEMFYFDFARRQFIGVFPRADRAHERSRAEQVVAAYEQALVAGAPGLRDLSGEFLVRVCFGYEELREKLVIDEARLDDLIVEALKCDLLQLEPWFAAHDVATLRLDQVGEDGRLCFVPEWLAAAPAGVEPRPVLVERRLYDATAAHAQTILDRRPGLASGPHVSLLRLIPWPELLPQGPGPRRPLV